VLIYRRKNQEVNKVTNTKS